MKKMISISSLILVLGLAMSVCAKTVELSPSADSLVKSDYPTSIFNDDTDLWPAKIGYNGQVNGIIHLAYIQYELPSDIQEITSATIKTIQTTNLFVTGVWYNLIKDGVSQPSPDTYTWNNSPANLSDMSLDYYNRYDPATAVEATYCSITRLDPVGQEYIDVVGEDAVTELNNDTDGVVTFFMVRKHMFDPWNQTGFGALENETYDPVRLELVYVPISDYEILIDQGDGVEVTEAGVTDNYTVALASAPAADVAVNMDYDESQITVSPGSIVFTPGSYGPVSVTVSAVNDSLPDGDVDVAITHTATSADWNYNLVAPAAADAAVLDDEVSRVTLTATTDCVVKNLDPNTSFPTGDLVAKYYATPVVTVDYAFARFELPADCIFVTNAKIKMVRTSVSGKDSTLSIRGIIDDVAQGDLSSYTWNTAPGFDNVKSPFGVDAEESSPVNTFDLPATGTAGEEFTGLESSNPWLVTFLNNDTDRVITLMLSTSRINEGDGADAWASTENGTYHAPQIELVYGTTNYCGQPGQSYSAGDFDEDCIVNLADFSVFAQQWLSD